MKLSVVALMLLPGLVWGQVKAVVPDTMIVTAARENLTEVITSIGQSMREVNSRSAPYSYTTETTRKDCFGNSDTTGVMVLYRNVARLSRDRAGATRRIMLTASTRRYEDGVLVWKSEDDKQGQAQWREPARPLLDSLPFAEGAADLYHYEVLERQLVGNTLLYHIAFKPRNGFDPLPSGEVWVDFTGWVMRRMTAHMSRGRTPTLLLAEVPHYGLVVEQRAGLWLPVDVHLVMNLKPSPLLTMPRSMDIRVKISDVKVHVLDEGVKSAQATKENHAQEFWLDPAAARDSLSVFWRGVDESLMMAGGLDLEDGPVAVSGDSLVEWADGELRELGLRGRRWQLRVPLRSPRFNRVQGLTPVIKVELGREAMARPMVTATVGLGLADGRWLGEVAGGGDFWDHRARWSSGIHSLAPSFGLASAQRWRDGAALTYGHDPRHYYAEREVSASLAFKVGGRFWVKGVVAKFEQWPLSQGTDWNLTGSQLSPAGNLAADRAKGGKFTLKLGGKKGHWRYEGGVTKLAGLGSDHRGPLQLGFKVRWRGMDSQGTAWFVTMQGRRWTRTAPLQDQIWLGDTGSLSGWSAGVLRGNSGCWGSVGADGSGDLLRSLRLPVLKELGLQPVGLLEVGLTTGPRVWDGRKVAANTGGPLGSVGVGFQRHLGLPWLGSWQKLRLLAAWPVGPGASEGGMRFILDLAKGSAGP